MKPDLELSSSKTTRRKFIQTGMLAAAAAPAMAAWPVNLPQSADREPSAQQPAPEFTGPGANPYWTSPGQFATYPQKAPLILLTDRPVQLETPRNYFLSTVTPNDAFFVRWHLQTIPNSVDLKEWRLHVEGNVDRPLTLSFPELTTRFKSVSIAAVNQCSGNSRSRLQPRVAGGQWGNGAMGNAAWTGVKLREILDAAGVKSGSVQVQFEGLDRGLGPKGFGSNRFMKSLDLTNHVIDECVIAFAMNDEPLPMLNGFPARLIVPGYFATYWLKSLSSIRVLDVPDDNFWMKAAYRIPDTLRGTAIPDDMKSGKVATIPIARMPVRSFLISPDGSTKIPAGFPLRLRGIAFSGYGGVKKLKSPSTMERTGPRPSSDRTRERIPSDLVAQLDSQGRRTIPVGRSRDGREGKCATRRRGLEPGRVLWNKIERQEIVVGEAS